jgi:hypothetical protein
MKTLWQAHLIEVNTLTKIQSQSLCKFQTKIKLVILSLNLFIFIPYSVRFKNMKN